MSTSLAAQTAAWQAQSEATQNAFGAFVRIDMPGYTLRVFTGGGVLQWDDGTGTQDWYGTELGEIGGIPGKSSFEAQALSLGLSGLDSSLKTEVMDYLVRGSDVYVWLFYISSGSIVADPWLAFAGKVDTPEFEEDQTVKLEVSVVDAVGAAFRRTVTRRTDTHQQSLFSGDRFYEFAPAVGRTPVKWGVPWSAASGGTRAGDANAAPQGVLRQLF